MAEKKQSRIAAFLEKQFEKTTKSQKEIAEHLGFPNANILVMFKKSITKVPLDRVAGLAKELEVDPAALFMMAMEQFYDGPAFVNDIFHDIIPTKGEAALLKAIRSGVTKQLLQNLPIKESDPDFELINAAIIKVLEARRDGKVAELREQLDLVSHAV